MGEEKKELDEWSVPATSRPKYFAFKVFGGWGAAGIMFAFLIRCWSSSVKEANIRGAEIERIVKETRAEMRTEMNQELDRYFRMLDRQEQRIDSVTSKVDTLDASL